MQKPPFWFVALAALTLLWNLLGLVAVASDFRLSEADIEAMPQARQALYHARPAWAAFGSGLAVVAGTLGSLLLLLRRRAAHVVLYASIAGILIQDAGFAVVTRVAGPLGPVPVVLQSAVLAIAVGLVLLARLAIRRAWLT